MYTQHAGAPLLNIYSKKAEGTFKSLHEIVWTKSRVSALLGASLKEYF